MSDVHVGAAESSSVAAVPLNNMDRPNTGVRPAMAPGDHGDDAKLLVHEWQILYSYASYFESPLPPLADIAANIVRHGIAESAYVSDGEAWWSTGDPCIVSEIGRQRKIEHGPVTVQLRADRTATVNLPRIHLHSYALNTILDAAQLRYQELFLFGETAVVPRYVRAYLGMFTFNDGERQLNCYPQLKIFETGPVVLYFRCFSPSEPQSVPELLAEYINARLTAFKRVMVPPGIAFWSTLAMPLDGALTSYRRPRTAWDQRGHRQVVKDATEIDKTTDFCFQLASIAAPSESAIMKAVEDTLARAGETILGAAKKESGIAWDNQSEDDLQRAVKARRRDGETLEETLGRIGEEISDTVKTKVTKVGEAVTDKVVELLDNREEMFAGIALMVMSIAGYVAATSPAGPPGLFALALGLSPRPNQLGRHWGGHVHVHIMRFAEQRRTASENEREYAAELGRIIAGTDFDDPRIARSMLPPSSRLFDDIGIYLSVNGSLWVQSQMSLDHNGSSRDPNGAEFLQEHQAKAELLDYSYALHRRIAQEATAANVTLETVLAAQRNLADFELALHDSSHFTEVRNLIQTGLDAYGVRSFRARVTNAISVRQALASQNQTRVTGRLGLLISAIGGALAIPSLATDVIGPLWRLWEWWLPVSDDARKLLFVAAATAVVAGAVTVGGYWARQRSRSD